MNYFTARWLDYLLNGQLQGKLLSACKISQACPGAPYIAGSIAALGSQYVLGLKAVGCAGGETLAEEQATASDKEKVLDALGQEAARLRQELAESLPSVQRFDSPLEQATTTSLDALKAYSMAVRAEYEQGFAAARPSFQRAIELDPSFASAYADLGLMHINLWQAGHARQYVTRAFALRDRTSQREKLQITAFYYDCATGELAKADETYQEWIESYPRDASAYINLSTDRKQEGDYASDSVRYASVGGSRLIRNKLSDSRKSVGVENGFSRGGKA